MNSRQELDSDAGVNAGKRASKTSDEEPSHLRRRLLFADKAGYPSALFGDSAQHETADGHTPSRTSCQPNDDLDDGLLALLRSKGLIVESEAAGIPAGLSAVAARAHPKASLGPVPVDAVATPTRPQDLLPASAAVPDTELPEVRVQNVIASGQVVVEGRRSASLDLRRIAVSCRFAEYNPRKISACIVRLRKPKCTGLIFRSGRVMLTGAQSEDAAFRASRLLVKMLQAILGPTDSVKARLSGETVLTKAPQLAAGMAREVDEGHLALEDAADSQFVKPAEPSGSDAVEASTADDWQALEDLGGKPLAPKNATTGKCDFMQVARNESFASNAASNGTFSRMRLTQYAVENIVATADCGLPVRLEGLAFEHKEFCSYEPELFAGLVYRYNPTPSLKAVLLIFVSGKVVITGCKTAAEIQEVFHSFFPVLLKYHT